MSARLAASWPFLAGLLILVASSANATEPTAPSVTVITASSGRLAERLTLTGTFVARDEAMVTPQIDGLAVTAILAEEGDRVEAGQVLARLSRDALDASLAENAASTARAQASISEAGGQIAESQANQTQSAAALARATDLLARGDLSHEAYDQRRAAAEVATARVQAATDQLAASRADLALALAQRRELEVRLARTDLRAPVAGLVSRRMARLGAVVGTASEPLFRIVANGTIEMEASVPETELAFLRPGQPATLTSIGTTRAGRVRLVSPEVSPASRLGRVRVALDDPSLIPTIGSFVRAAVEVADRSGVIVPLSAVLFAPGGPVVAVVANGAVAIRHVTVGLSDASRAEIDHGLAAGDAVVAVSGTFLRDGDRVAAVPVSATGYGD